MNVEVPIPLTETSEGLLLPVRAQPRARKNAVVGAHAGQLKVAVTAAPERGKANAALIQVLCKALLLKPAQVSLHSGASSSSKRFLVTEITREELAERLAACVNS
jgi:hypothetical protein